MKRFVIISGIALAFLTSCTEDARTVLNPDGFVPSEWIRGDNNSIFAGGDEITLQRGEAENVFATLRWTETGFGYSAAVTYNIEVATANDGTVSDYVTVATTQATSYEVLVKDFNSWLVGCGAEKSRTNDMLMRLSASISGNYRPVYSEVYEFRANVFSTEPDRLYFVSAETGSLGEADYVLSPDFNSKYDGFVHIPYGDDGVWLVEDMHPEVRWGLSASTEQGTKLGLVRESDGGQPVMPGAFGTGDVDASFVGNGYYRVHCDLGTDEKTVEIWRFYGDFNIVGQRNMNYVWWANSMGNQKQGNVVDGKPWGTGAKLTYYPEERVWKTESVYVPKYTTGSENPPVTTETLWQFKLRANDSWGPAIEGGGSSDDTVDGDGVQSGEIGVKNIGGATGNITFNGEEGWYHWEVFLGERPFRYRLVPDAEPETSGK